MNKRDAVLSLINNETPSDYIPAGFFMHFDPACHRGQAAINKHLEFFHYTGMDFVKIQFEQHLPPLFIDKPEDWNNLPLFSLQFFEPILDVVERIVKAAKSEALVVMTLYSPLMWALHLDERVDLVAHLKENPDAVKKGLEIMTENVLRLIRGCKRAGIDGFYASSQGGESFRFSDKTFFTEHIKPTDLAVWDEIQACTFNILHICDYKGGYTDLTPFLNYPGHVVNSSLKLGDKHLTPQEISHMFNRPFMGGLERTRTIATGNTETIRAEVNHVLAQKSARFILAADCTVPSGTPWENLKIAIDTAHEYRGQ